MLPAYAVNKLFLECNQWSKWTVWSFNTEKGLKRSACELCCCEINQGEKLIQNFLSKQTLKQFYPTCAHIDPKENNTMLEIENIHIINVAAVVAATIINDNDYYLLSLL